jgi:hypothetical protein
MRGMSLSQALTAGAGAEAHNRVVGLVERRRRKCAALSERAAFNCIKNIVKGVASNIWVTRLKVKKSGNLIKIGLR